MTFSFRSDNAYNCNISFVFTSDYLLFIEGKRTLERDNIIDGKVLDTATILLRFLSEIRESGIICSELKSLEQCYIMQASASGEGTMTPFWRIETDVGIHYINGVSGKREAIF